MDVKKVKYIKSHNFDDKLANDPTYIKEKKGHLMTIDNFVFYWKRAGFKRLCLKPGLKKKKFKRKISIYFNLTM